MSSRYIKSAASEDRSKRTPAQKKSDNKWEKLAKETMAKQDARRSAAKVMKPDPPAAPALKKKATRRQKHEKRQKKCSSAGHDLRTKRTSEAGRKLQACIKKISYLSNKYVDKADME